MQDGDTALMYAILNGKSDVLTELIPLGADINIQANVSHFLCLTITRPKQFGNTKFEVTEFQYALSTY